MENNRTTRQEAFNKSGYYIEDNVYSTLEMKEVFFTFYDIC